mgnify:CR=1 FL=1
MGNVSCFKQQKVQTCPFDFREAYDHEDIGEPRVEVENGNNRRRDNARVFFPVRTSQRECGYTKVSSGAELRMVHDYFFGNVASFLQSFARPTIAASRPPVLTFSRAVGD